MSGCEYVMFKHTFQKISESKRMSNLLPELHELHQGAVTQGGQGSGYADRACCGLAMSHRGLGGRKTDMAIKACTQGAA